MSQFEETILDNPLELLKTIEHQVHVPSRAVYPTLTLIESLTRMLSIRQGEKEGLTSYMERFKSERNVLNNLFGYSILDSYCANQSDYRAITGATDDEILKAQKEYKEDEMSKFWAMLFLKCAD